MSNVLTQKTQAEGATVHVEVGVLGPWHLHVDGEPIVVGRRQVRTLLARLALTANHVGAGSLIDLLWPEDIPADPRAALNVVLSRSRTALGGSAAVLESTGNAYRLVAHTDASRFTEAVDRAMSTPVARRADHLIAALEFWRGIPFEDLPEHPAFRYEAHRLEGIRDRARSDMLDALVASGRLDEVIDIAGPLVDREPDRVAESIALARALAGIGRRREGLRVLSRLRRHESLVGLDTPPRVAVAEAAILATSTDIDAAEPLSDPGTLIIGRHAELHRLATLPSRKVAMITGEPGIGKSALLEGAAERWRSLGRPTFHVRATAMPARLMDPVAQLLQQCLAEQGRPIDPTERAAVSVVVPDRNEASGPWIATRDELVAALARFIATRLEPGDVVTIDNAHLVDGLSADVLRTVARSSAITLVLAAPSTQEVMPHDEIDEQIELEALGIADVEEWIRKEADHCDVDAAALRHRTGGNPLFLNLLIEMITDDLDTTTLPATLVATVQQRLDRLSPPARELLSTAAALGDTVPLPLLELVHGTVEGTIRELQSCGLAEIGGQTMSFRHGLVTEAVAHIHGDGARLSTLDAAARAAEQADRPVIEYWRYCVETAVIDPDRALRAAAKAAGMLADVYAWDEVTACVQAGLNVAETAGRVGREVLELRILDARSRFATGRLGGDTLLFAVVDDARAAGDVRVQVAAITELSHAGCWALLGRDANALAALIDEGLSIAETPEERIWLQASSARSLGYSLHHRAGQAHYRDAIRSLDDVQQPRIRWTILRNAEYGLAGPGDLCEAERMCDRMDTEMGWNPEIKFLVAWTRYRHGIMRGDAGKVVASRREAEQAERSANGTETPLAYGHTSALSMQLAWADAGFAMMCGDLETSEGHANRSLDIVDQSLATRDEQSIRSWAMTGYGALLVGLRRQQGRLSELASLAGDLGGSVPAWRSAVTAIRLATGDVSGAREAIEPLAADGWAGLVPDQTSTGVVHLLTDATEIMTRTELEQLAAMIEPFTDRFSCVGAYSLGPLSLAAASVSDALGRDDAARLRATGEQQWQAFREQLTASAT